MSPAEQQRWRIRRCEEQALYWLCAIYPGTPGVYWCRVCWQKISAAHYTLPYLRRHAEGQRHLNAVRRAMGDPRCHRYLRRRGSVWPHEGMDGEEMQLLRPVLEPATMAVPPAITAEEGRRLDRDRAVATEEAQWMEAGRQALGYQHWSRLGSSVPHNPSNDPDQRAAVEQAARVATANEGAPASGDRQTEVLAGFDGYLRTRGLAGTSRRGYRKVVVAWFKWRHAHAIADAEWPPKGIHLCRFVHPTPAFQKDSMGTSHRAGFKHLWAFLKKRKLHGAFRQSDLDELEEYVADRSVASRPKESRPHVAYTKAQLDSMLKGLEKWAATSRSCREDAERWRLAIALLLQGGLRVSEIAQEVSLEKVEPTADPRIVNVPNWPVSKARGGIRRTRLVQGLHCTLINALKEWQANFAHRRRQGRCPAGVEKRVWNRWRPSDGVLGWTEADSAARWIKRVARRVAQFIRDEAKKAGTDPDAAARLLDHIQTHDLRTSRLNELSKSMPIEMLAAWVGHARIATTLGYLKPARADENPQLMAALTKDVPPGPPPSEAAGMPPRSKA